MAYGLKFELTFSDPQGNPRRLEILQDGYTGDAKALVGTDDPVRIKWDNNDDFYSPIIGSTCEINLFVTDDTDYDDWFDTDEREYRVRVLAGDISGGKIWDTTDDEWAAANFTWSDGTDQGFEFYWEGYLVVDRYQELMQPTPFPIRLIASDGLGTLNGFQSPYSNVNLLNGVPAETTGSQSNFDTLFYYLRKILENTGLDFDIYISNNIVEANQTAEQTIFHSIQPFEFGLLKNNFRQYNAKELLAHILRITNSRVFQSNGRWYVISNSNIMDERVFAGRPTVEDLEVTILKNETGDVTLIGNDPDDLALTFAITDDVTNGSTSLSNDVVTITPTTDYVGGDFFKYTANNGTLTSDKGTVSINVIESTDPQQGDLEPMILASSLAWWYKGDSVQQCLSRVRGFTQKWYRTNPEDTAAVNAAGQNPEVDTRVGFTAGYTVDGDEKSIRFLAPGSNLILYSRTTYDLFHGTQETNPNWRLDIPFYWDNTNGIYKMPDGYFGTTGAVILTREHNAAYTGFYSNARTSLGISRSYDYTEFQTDYPVFYDILNNDPAKNNATIIHIVRVVNGFITESYKFNQ